VAEKTCFGVFEQPPLIARRFLIYYLLLLDVCTIYFRRVWNLSGVKSTILRDNRLDVLLGAKSLAAPRLLDGRKAFLDAQFSSRASHNVRMSSRNSKRRISTRFWRVKLPKSNMRPAARTVARRRTRGNKDADTYTSGLLRVFNAEIQIHKPSDLTNHVQTF